MYTKAYWEDVNSIKGSCTSVIGPNLRLYCVTPMYTDVQRWMIITAKSKEIEDSCPRALFGFWCQFPQEPLVEMRC
jgi:hypothetical protein